MIKRAQIEQYNLKVALWEKFCSKDYPASGIRGQEFVKIIFEKAKKTYQRYVRLYYSIGKFDRIGTEEQLLFSEKSFSDLSLALLNFKDLFKRDIQALKMEQKIDRFIQTVEVFGLCVLDDWVSFNKTQIEFFQNTKPAA